MRISDWSSDVCSSDLRIACPWLITRFIDDAPEFLYVPADQVFEVAEREGAIAYDIPGAEFSHVGEKCSFDAFLDRYGLRSEEHTSELQSLMRISYAVFCLKKKKKKNQRNKERQQTSKTIKRTQHRKETQYKKKTKQQT